MDISSVTNSGEKKKEAKNLEKNKIKSEKTKKKAKKILKNRNKKQQILKQSNE